MFMLDSAILLMGVRTRNKMGYPNGAKERIQPFILTTPITLDRYDLAIIHALHKSLEFFKEFKNFISMMKQVNPSEFAKIINKTGITLFMTKGVNCRT
jgi:hypothetical protein